MDMNITEKKEEAPLSRVRLTGEIAFESVTPSYEEVRKKISSSLDCDEKLIVIKNIYTKFGMKKASLFAYVYKNEESMKKIEPKPKVKKAKPGEEEKQEDKKEPPKETKGEKPVEEEKGESPKEEKKKEAEKKEDKKE